MPCVNHAVTQLDLPVPFDQTFDALYGLEVIELGEERATARVPVRDAIKQPMGLVHGGIYCAMAESLVGIKRAGADFIITYAAKEASQWLST